jgi:hypothetical protein
MQGSCEGSDRGILKLEEGQSWLQKREEGEAAGRSDNWSLEDKEITM